MRTRNISLTGCCVRLYYNPGRLKNATAAVGQNDLRDRPCFLCLQNLPEEQEWIAYRNEFRILCNPLPVFPSHFTIAHVGHRPQAIGENFDAFLLLMADLGFGWTVFYNGPRCGASAPDHLHFQAMPTGHMPVEKEILELPVPIPAIQLADVCLYKGADMVRQVILLESDNRASLTKVFMSLLSFLKEVTHAEDEPMVNLAGCYKDNSWRVAIFPRQKHRPDVFYLEGDERILVSPGAVEMAGLLVTPVERDFERLDAHVVEAIYREVSLDGRVLVNLIDALARENQG